MMYETTPSGCVIPAKEREPVFVLREVWGPSPIAAACKSFEQLRLLEQMNESYYRSMMPEPAEPD